MTDGIDKFVAIKSKGDNIVMPVDSLNPCGADFYLLQNSCSMLLKKPFITWLLSIVVAERCGMFWSRADG
jgi:hypothetical protein